MNLNHVIVLLIVVLVSVNAEFASREIDLHRYEANDYLNFDMNVIYKGMQTHLVSKTSGGPCDAFKKYLTFTAGEAAPMWFIQMIDAWSKIPSGILTGNLIDNGQFDECYNLEAISHGIPFKGQYCGRAIQFSTEALPLPLALSVCVPNDCEMPMISIPEVGLNITNILCQTSDLYSEFEWDDWVVTGVLIGILVLIVLNTIYDLILYMNESKPKHQLLIAFSLFTNGRKLFTVSNSSTQVDCLNGIRALSLMWIIAGHRYVSEQGVPKINMVEVFEWKADEGSGYISSGRASVDTFFLLAAFLVSYNYFKGIKSAMAKAEAKGSKEVQNPLTLSKIPMYYVHRILRIIPALAALFFVQITIVRYIGTGPIWPVLMKMTVDACTKWWWSLFLFVQNYVNYTDMCIVPTWYLSADMQMYILSPFLIIPLGELVIKGKKKLAYVILFILTVICVVVPMIIDFYREFEILNIYETHQRLAVYVIGIIFGMIVVDCKDKKININYGVNLLLWALSLGAMSAIVFTMHTTEVHPEKLKNNLYFTFTRPVWSIAICWITFACHFGYGGPINWFLSKTIFQITTRLSFSMYLLHNLMISVSIGSAKVTTHFSEYEVMYNWCGDYIFTVMLSIVWVLCFESPIVVLEKVIFSPSGKKSQPSEISTVQRTMENNKTEAEQA